MPSADKGNQISFKYQDLHRLPKHSSCWASDAGTTGKPRACGLPENGSIWLTVGSNHFRSCLCPGRCKPATNMFQQPAGNLGQRKLKGCILHKTREARANCPTCPAHFQPGLQGSSSDAPVPFVALDQLCCLPKGFCTRTDELPHLWVLSW